jgi:hypothetical protein
MESPLVLALLKGLEKLKAGRGRRVPPTDISELIEGDLGTFILYISGEIGDVDNPLPDKGLQCGDTLCVPLEVAKSSSELSDIDLGLGVLCENGDRGGANALES